MNKKKIIFFIVVSYVLFMLNSSNIYKILDDNYLFNAYTSNESWNNKESLNIFGEDTLLYPGISGVYKFDVKNNSSASINYKIYGTDNSAVNMYYRLRDSENSTEWRKMNDLSFTKDLDKYSKNELYLDWKWVDNNKADYTNKYSVYLYIDSN